MDALIPTLALITLGSFLAFAVMQLFTFSRRSNSNRDAVKRAFSDHSAGSRGTQDR